VIIIKVEGSVIQIWHRGLEINDLDDGVDIEANVLKWKGNGFVKEKYHQKTKLRHGKHRFILDKIPEMAAPVVITDDMVDYSDDASMLGREFIIESNEEDKAEIKFNHNWNMIENSQFDYLDEEYTGSISPFAIDFNSPSNWGIYSGECVSLSALNTSYTGVTGVVAGSGAYTGYKLDSGSAGYYDLYPVIGNKYAMMSGEIRQRVRVEDKNTYWMSAYLSKPKETGSFENIATGNCQLAFDFYDIEMRPLSSATADTIYLTSDYSQVTGMWSRKHVRLSHEEDLIKGKPSPDNDIRIPENSTYIDVRLISNTPICVDAVAFTNSESLEDFTRSYRGSELTIEYETGTTELYHVNDLSLNPVRNFNNNGFMYIGPIPSKQFDVDAPQNSTTLTDWKWAKGRVEILPWARTDGKNKLRQRGNFNKQIKGQKSNITINPNLSYPEEIEVIPRVPISNMIDGRSQTDYFTGGTPIAGSDFSVRVIDDNENPYAFEWVDVYITDSLDNVSPTSYMGVIGSKEMGFYNQFENPITVQLDSAGIANLRWIPPSLSESMQEISNVDSRFSLDDDGSWYISDLSYRVNEAGHGNVFLTCPLYPDGIYGTGEAFYSGAVSSTDKLIVGANHIHVYDLPSCPDIETIDVWINHTGVYSLTGSSQEIYDVIGEQSNTPELYHGQYFVDEHKKKIFLNWSKQSNNDVKTIYVKYRERDVFIKKTDDDVTIDDRIYFSEEFKNYITSIITPSNPLSITYDIRGDLYVKAHSPYGMDVDYAYVSSNNVGGIESVNIRERVYNGAVIGKNTKIRPGHNGTI
jgi:hypothetical protein